MMEDQGNKSTILIVDDMVSSILVLDEVLKDAYHTFFATDGQSALNSLSELRPDMILLDIQMPDMDGLEVCKRLKSDPKLARIPVIFMTALSEDQMETAGLELGAVDYITKPFNPAVIQLRVKNQLLLKQYQDHLEDLVQQRTARLQETTAKLQKAMETVAASDRAKTRFLMIISHELRSPLNGIVGYSDLLTTMLEEGDSLEYAQGILTAGHRMTAIVNDVFEFVRLETGMVQLVRQPYAIRDMIAKAVKAIRKQYRDKELAFSSEVAEDIPEMVEGDFGYTRQLLTRILDNAFKFTAAGSVHLTVTLSQDSPQGQRLLFSVRDSGEGVTQERQDEIFGHFTYGNNDLMTQHRGGMGMGLAICRQIVALMRGQIWLASSSAAGSAFCFAVPCQEGERPESSGAVAPSSELPASYTGTAPPPNRLQQLRHALVNNNLAAIRQLSSLLPQLPDSCRSTEGRQLKKAVFSLNYKDATQIVDRIIATYPHI
ncbi:MAG: response regulator [Magnetococcales bacterium]|nr:response regulator [Magnetococcales bacterium]